MRNTLLWRAVLILGLGAFSFWRFWPAQEKLNLGLDLQGGIHLVLGVETQDAVRSETDKDLEVLRREAIDDGVAGISTNRLTDTTFEATGFAADKLQAVEQAARDWLGGGWEWSRDDQRLFPLEHTAPTSSYARWWERIKEHWNEIIEPHRLDLMVEELKALIRFLEVTEANFTGWNNRGFSRLSN